MMLGSLSDTAMSSMRPPMLAGPIERNLNGLSSPSDDWLIIGCGSCAAPWGNTVVTSIGTAPVIRATRTSLRTVCMGSNLFDGSAIVAGPTRINVRECPIAGTWLSTVFAVALTCLPKSQQEEREEREDGSGTTRLADRAMRGSS